MHKNKCGSGDGVAQVMVPVTQVTQVTQVTLQQPPPLSYKTNLGLNLLNDQGWSCWIQCAPPQGHRGPHAAGGWVW